jgi:hypothetical protein
LRRAGRLELPAFADRAGRHAFTSGPGFKCQSHFPGAPERPADISIFRTDIERNQPIAMLTVGLKPVADSLRPLPEYLRASRAFYFDLFVDHEMPLADSALSNATPIRLSPRQMMWQC